MENSFNPFAEGLMKLLRIQLHVSCESMNVFRCTGACHHSVEDTFLKLITAPRVDISSDPSFEKA